MSTATITSKGQVTIPVSVRQRLGVQPGDRVGFIEMENGVFQLVAASWDIRSMKGQVSKPAKAVTIEEMNETIESRGRA